MRRLGLLVILLSTSLASCQEKPARLTFDVASIRPTNTGTLNGMIKALPGGHGYTAQNIPVKLMFSLMYKVPMRQIKGDPEWLNADRYDVEARVDGSYNIDDLHTMFQILLEDRFHLKFHKETKEGNVYALTVDPSGLKMKRNDSAQDFNIPITFTNDGVSGVRVPMNYLSWWLGQNLQRDERPVIDLTGLEGNYDFKLTFAPPLPPDVVPPPEFKDRPSLFDALRDQLGLRLKAQTGPVDFYVIDHVERPSEN